MTDPTNITFGGHSEFGTLRKVLVCSPGLAHTRLTPSNCDAPPFDDVLWVKRNKRDLRSCQLPGSDPAGCSSLYQRCQAYPLAGLLADSAAAFTVNTLVATYGPRSIDRRCVTPCA